MEVHEEEIPDVTRYIEGHKHVDLEHNRGRYESIMWRLRRYVRIDQNTKMLEIGIGTGWFPIMCKKEGLQCKGIEISPQLIEYAREFGRRHGIEADVELGNIEDMDIGESVYDIILAESVFEHVEDWRTGLQRTYRALKPGGLLYFSSTNKFSLVSHEYHWPLYGWMPDRWRYKLRCARQGEQIMKLGIDFNQFTFPQLRRAFKEVGFSTVLDQVEMLDPEKLRTPSRWKTTLLHALRKFGPAKHLVLTFAPSTTFVCIK
ncbi:MAG: class I SAM-dependent methyltransferase [bacterium]